LWTGTDWKTTHTGDITGTAPWPMRYGQVAPRIALAYRLPRPGLVLRAGAGAFYDTTLGATINPVSGAPFNSWQLSSRLADGGFSTGSSIAPTVWQGAASADVQRFLKDAQPALAPANLVAMEGVNGKEHQVPRRRFDGISRRCWPEPAWEPGLPRT